MTPERAQGYLGAIMPLLREGGPVVALLLLLVGAVQIYYLLGVITANRTATLELLDKLLACKNEQIHLLQRQGHQP